MEHQSFPSPEQLGYARPPSAAATQAAKPDFIEWLFSALNANAPAETRRREVLIGGSPEPPYNKATLTRDAWQRVYEAGWRLGTHYRGSGTAVVPAWDPTATEEAPTWCWS